MAQWIRFISHHHAVDPKLKGPRCPQGVLSIEICNRNREQSDTMMGIKGVESFHNLFDIIEITADIPKTTWDILHII